MSNRIRCAIYTRKSTEEGLEQEFNSLDAQREACESYIQSQKGLGWTILKKQYDDGGISGATMERPALKELLEDIERGKVDLVVVYKVDRLTRSLMDFSRMIETFDARKVSFVSVTQQFNTANSMGRLTLNVLLSFAQFEREVTAERIRDKIAASKKKGMWMGGLTPLGYDAVDKKLVVNEDEAETVRKLFNLYLEYGNVRQVREEANRSGLRTKIRKPNNGKRRGGAPFTRGHIYKILKNAIYIGEIVHKGMSYEGEHEAIINKSIWDRVQEQMTKNAVVRKCAANAKSPSLLTGLLFDENGARLKPSHACKADRRYRYYITDPDPEGILEGSETWRLPAKEIEAVVIDGVIGFFENKVKLLDAMNVDDYDVGKVLSGAAKLAIQLRSDDPSEQRKILLGLMDRTIVCISHIRVVFHPSQIHEHFGTSPSDSLNTLTEIDIAVAFRRRGVEKRIVIRDERLARREPDPKLIELIAQAHA